MFTLDQSLQFSYLYSAVIMLPDCLALTVWCPHVSVHRIVEEPMLEGISKDHLIQHFLRKRAYMKFSSTLSNCTLKTFSDGDSTKFC